MMDLYAQDARQELAGLASLAVPIAFGTNTPSWRSASAPGQAPHAVLPGLMRMKTSLLPRSLPETAQSQRAGRNLL